MDLFFAMGGVFLYLLLWRAYTQNISFISLITSPQLLILSIFIMESFKHRVYKYSCDSPILI